MLKHRLFRKALPKIFDDLNESLREKIIDTNIRMILTNRHNKIIGQVKLDMMAIYISTGEAKARGHAKVAEEEKDRLLLREKTSGNVHETILNNLVNAIQAREENIIKRAKYVTNCKMSFFDETPTMVLID
jgi:hypothetical protein